MDKKACFDLPDNMENFKGNININCCCCKGGNGSGGNSGGNVNNVAAIGAVLHFAMVDAPEGWLKCDGAEVSRKEYVNLFDAIGTVYGDGDGSETFNVPDLRGEFIRGYDDSSLVDEDRVFGSRQKASVITYDPCMTSIDVTGLYNTINDDMGDFRIRAGYDKVEMADYLGVNAAGVHNVKTGSTDECFAGVRPRNVALLACIKY